MATLKKGSQDIILSEISGKIGDIIIRHRYGKTIICAKPKKVARPRTPEVQIMMNKLKVISRFASFLLKGVPLKPAWEEANINCITAFNKICKLNLKLSDTDRPSINNLITPPHHHFRIEDVILLEDHFVIIMENWFQPDENDKCIMILMVYDPVDEGCSAFELIDISPEGNSELVVNIDSENIQKLQRYKKFILYTAVIREVNDSVQWSNTFSISGSLIP